MTMRMPAERPRKSSIAPTAATAMAAELKATYPLSLADAWIAACARLHGALLVHKDPEFGTLPIDQETLPLKAKKGKARAARI